jgi:inosine triphosphate pyrophosphatase
MVCRSACGIGPGAEPQVFVGRTRGCIVPGRGPTSFGWDPIFQPEGFQETYAEMNKAVKNTISHRWVAAAAALQHSCALSLLACPSKHAGSR